METPGRGRKSKSTLSKFLGMGESLEISILQFVLSLLIVEVKE